MCSFAFRGRRREGADIGVRTSLLLTMVNKEAKPSPVFSTSLYATSISQTGSLGAPAKPWPCSRLLLCLCGASAEAEDELGGKNGKGSVPTGKQWVQIPLKKLPAWPQLDECAQLSSSAGSHLGRSRAVV